MEEVNYHIHDMLLYHLGKLCIPQGERVHVIREANSSRVSRHFGVGKIVAQLKKNCYWPRMNETVHKFKMRHDKHRKVHTSRCGDVEYL